MKYYKSQDMSYKAHTGFTLLLSLLIISIVLAISLGVFGIIVREISISTSARESRLAFYAANTGIECAVYWDFVQNAFASDTPPTTITCNGYDFTVGGSESSVIDETSSPTGEKLKLDNGSCAFEVTVEKSCVSGTGGCSTGNEPDKRILTTIRSRGHNNCSGGFVVERGLQAEY